MAASVCPTSPAPTMSVRSTNEGRDQTVARETQRPSGTSSDGGEPEGDQRRDGGRGPVHEDHADEDQPARRGQGGEAAQGLERRGAADAAPRFAIETEDVEHDDPHRRQRQQEPEARHGGGGEGAEQAPHERRRLERLDGPDRDEGTEGQRDDVGGHGRRLAKPRRAAALGRLRPSAGSATRGQLVVQGAFAHVDCIGNSPAGDNGRLGHEARPRHHCRLGHDARAAQGCRARRDRQVRDEAERAWRVFSDGRARGGHVVRFHEWCPQPWPVGRPAVPPRPAYSLPLPGTDHIKSVQRVLGQKDSVYSAGNERADSAGSGGGAGTRRTATRRRRGGPARGGAARGDAAGRRPPRPQTIVSTVSIERARPPSIETSTASMRTGPSATSNCTGISVRKRRRMISLLTPMTDSAGPVMPTSVM